MSTNSSNISTTSDTHAHFEFYFDLVFAEPEAYASFASYACKYHNTENINFLRDLQKLKENQTKQLAEKLYQTFVQEDGAFELNVPKSVKEKCWDMISQGKYGEAFEDCQVAAYQHLAHVFSMYKRSDTFVKFIRTKKLAFWKRIGKHKSEITNTTLTVTDMERTMFTDEDFFFVQGAFFNSVAHCYAELNMDYDYWVILFSDQKAGTYMKYSTRVFQDDESMKKIGYMVPLKTSFTFRAECTLQHVMQVLSSKEVLMQMYTIASMTHATINTGDHTGTIVQGEANLGAIFSPRQFCELWTFAWDDKAKCLFFLRKTCKPADFVKKPHTVMMHQFVICRVSQILPGWFAMDQVGSVAFGGNMTTTPAKQKNLNFLLKWATGPVVNGFIKILLPKIDALVKGTWQSKDELGLYKNMYTPKMMQKL